MQPNTLFVYGILKRGFQLDLTERGAKFIGEAQLPGAILYRIGHGGVGLRLVEDPNRVAYGEVFEIPGPGKLAHHDIRGLWPWLDEIEANGLAYKRKVVKVLLEKMPDNDMDLPYETVDAWVYEHTYPGARYDRPIDSGKYEYVEDY